METTTKEYELDLHTIEQKTVEVEIVECDSCEQEAQRENAITFSYETPHGESKSGVLCQLCAGMEMPPTEFIDTDNNDHNEEIHEDHDQLQFGRHFADWAGSVILWPVFGPLACLDRILYNRPQTETSHVTRGYVMCFVGTLLWAAVIVFELYRLVPFV